MLLDGGGRTVLWSNRAIESSALGEDFLAGLLGQDADESASDVVQQVYMTGTWSGSVCSQVADALVQQADSGSSTCNACVQQQQQKQPLLQTVQLLEDSDHVEPVIPPVRTDSHAHSRHSVKLVAADSRAVRNDSAYVMTGTDVTPLKLPSKHCEPLNAGSSGSWWQPEGVTTLDGAEQQGQHRPSDGGVMMALPGLSSVVPLPMIERQSCWSPATGSEQHFTQQCSAPLPLPKGQQVVLDSAVPGFAGSPGIAPGSACQRGVRTLRFHSSAVSGEELSEEQGAGDSQERRFMLQRAKSAVATTRRQRSATTNSASLHHSRSLGGAAASVVAEGGDKGADQSAASATGQHLLAARMQLGPRTAAMLQSLGINDIMTRKCSESGQMSRISADGSVASPSPSMTHTRASVYASPTSTAPRAPKANTRRAVSCKMSVSATSSTQGSEEGDYGDGGRLCSTPLPADMTDTGSAQVRR